MLPGALQTLAAVLKADQAPFLEVLQVLLAVMMAFEKSDQAVLTAAFTAETVVN